MQVKGSDKTWRAVPFISYGDDFRHQFKAVREALPFLPARRPLQGCPAMPATAAKEGRGLGEKLPLESFANGSGLVRYQTNGE